MNNVTTFKFRNPLGISIRGTGEYVKREVAHLVDLFDMAEFDHEQEIRQDIEHD